MTSVFGNSAHLVLTTVLVILDGWGHGESSQFNAIHAAHTPTWDEYWARSPRTLLSCSGESVGLPPGQMGNSEVGHMTIGAGRVIRQDLSRISHEFDSGFLDKSAVLKRFADSVGDNRIHILGLLSPGGVHSHESHISAVAQHFMAQNKHVAIHAFLDGRDTPPRHAENSIRSFVDQGLEIASISGRYYAMDRDERWERTKRVYDMLVDGKTHFRATSSLQALQDSYLRDESDEFVQPTLIKGFKPIQTGDAIVFMNFRADRARQLSRAFVLDEFNAFPRNIRPDVSHFVTLTPYAHDINDTSNSIVVDALFEPENIVNSLGEWIAKEQRSQLRIAESEKYGHVTYFFSCGRETEFDLETRQIVDSPKVATYDLLPRMSADQVVDSIVDAIHAQKFDVIICNFANGDMVGHTGNLKASIEAVECVDECLGKIFETCDANLAQCFVTADHGNVENLYNRNASQPDTAHTNNPVPFMYVGSKELRLVNSGTLADIAPTLLVAMDLPIPKQMSGQSLIQSERRSVVI